jgi:hypothetical protein
MHSCLYFMVEWCYMYLIVVVHSKSNYIYVFIEYGPLNELKFYVVYYFCILNWYQKKLWGHFSSDVIQLGAGYITRHFN